METLLYRYFMSRFKLRVTTDLHYRVKYWLNMTEQLKKLIITTLNKHEVLSTAKLRFQKL